MLVAGSVFALAGCQSNVDPDSDRYLVVAGDILDAKERVAEIQSDLEALTNEVNTLRNTINAESGAETELGSE